MHRRVFNCSTLHREADNEHTFTRQVCIAYFQFCDVLMNKRIGAVYQFIVGPGELLIRYSTTHLRRNSIYSIDFVSVGR